MEYSKDLERGTGSTKAHQSQSEGVQEPVHQREQPGRLPNEVGPEVQLGVKSRAKEEAKKRAQESFQYVEDQFINGLSP